MRYIENKSIKMFFAAKTLIIREKKNSWCINMQYYAHLLDL